MRESLLHGLWEQQKLPFTGLKLTSGEKLQVWNPGSLNKNAGPDFLNARIVIGGTLWAGHVEMHQKSSHWKTHGHASDPNYLNVILHVIWEDDKPILGYHGSQIPTLQLRDYVSHDLLVSMLRLRSTQRNMLINCQRDHHVVPRQIKEDWWLRLYKERLLAKASEIQKWLDSSQSDWEQVLFISLLRSFGLHINADAFLSLGLKLDYSIIKKLKHDSCQLEALLLGMTGLLDNTRATDCYTNKLQSIFQYQYTRFSLNRVGILRPHFLRLRPSNFPTIRLSQLSVLMSTQPRLFGKLMSIYERRAFHKLLSVSASRYWETHYTFGKLSKKRVKKVSTSLVDLLIINSLAPLKLAYARAMGKDIWPLLRPLIESCPPEHNSILSNLSQIGMRATNALQSQALLQKYEHYCEKNRCLECALGRYLLKGI